MIRCQSAIGYSHVGAFGPAIPAEATSMSIRPIASAVVTPACITAAASTRSRHSVCTATPSRAAIPSSAARSRSHTTSRAPSAANRRQIANPIPETPPVTTATLPANRPAIASSLASRPR